MDICGPIIGFGIVLAVIAALGHGLWLIGAALLRPLFEPSSEVPTVQCSNCQYPVRTDRQRCPRCYRPIAKFPEKELEPRSLPQSSSVRTASTESGQIDEWGIAIRLVRGLARKDLIPVSEADHVCRLLHQQSLLEVAAEETDRVETDDATQAPSQPASDMPSEKPFRELMEIGPLPTSRPRPEVTPPKVDSTRSKQPSDDSSASSDSTSDQQSLPAQPAAVELSDFIDDSIAAGASASVAAASEQADSVSRLETQGLGHIAQSFMEERNIRWGELISGMLIIGSASGLVISLWSSLDAIPYFPALIFLLITTALHGAGRYTLKRWRLRSTSRGLLLISTLLIPLNFVGAIALSERDVSVTDPFYLVAVTVGLGVFTVLARSTGKLLMLTGEWLLAAAVMIPCVGQLFIARVTTPDTGRLELIALAAIPAIGFIGSLGLHLQSVSKWKRFTPRRVQQLLSVPGLATFSLVIPLALLCSKTKAPLQTLDSIAPILSLIAATITSCGLWIHRHLLDRRFSQQRTAGTAISVLGGIGLVSSVALAWPHPENLIAIGLVNAAVLTAFAVYGRLALMHVPAILSLSVTALITGLRWNGILSADASSRELVSALILGRSALFLAVTAIVFFVTAAFAFKKRTAIRSMYMAGAQAVLFVALCIALFAGWYTGQDASLCTIVMILGSIVAWLWPYDQRSETIGVSLSFGLSFVTLSHAFGDNPWLQQNLWEQLDWTESPWLLSLQTIAVSTAIVLTGRSVSGDFAHEPRREFWLRVSQFAQALPIVSVAATLLFSEFGPWGRGIEVGLSAAALTAIALVVNSPHALIIAYGGFHLFAGMLTTAVCRQQSWWGGAHQLAHFQWQLTAAAIVASSWHLLLSLGQSISRIRRTTAGFPHYELWIQATVAAVFSVMTLAAVVPLVPDELPVPFRSLSSNQTWLFLTLATAALFTLYAPIRALAKGRIDRIVSTAIIAWAGGSVAFSIPAPGLVDQWLNYSQRWSEQLPTVTVLGIMFLATVLSMLRARTSIQWGTGAALAFVALLLVALRFHEQPGTTTILRWALGVFVLAISCVAVITRSTSSELTREFQFRSIGVNATDLVRLFLSVLLISLSVRAGCSLLMAQSVSIMSDWSSSWLIFHILGPLLVGMFAFALPPVVWSQKSNDPMIGCWTVPTLWQLTLILICVQQADWREPWLTLNWAVSGYLLTSIVAELWQQFVQPQPSIDEPQHAPIFDPGWLNFPRHIGIRSLLIIFGSAALLIGLDAPEFSFTDLRLTNGIGAMAVLLASSSVLWHWRSLDPVSRISQVTGIAFLATIWCGVWQYSQWESPELHAVRCLQSGTTAVFLGLCLLLSLRPQWFTRTSGTELDQPRTELRTESNGWRSLLPSAIQSWMAVLAFTVLGFALRAVIDSQFALNPTLLSVGLVVLGFAAASIRTRDVQSQLASVALVPMGISLYWLRELDVPIESQPEPWMWLVFSTFAGLIFAALAWSCVLRWVWSDQLQPMVVHRQIAVGAQRLALGGLLTLLVIVTWQEGSLGRQWLDPFAAPIAWVVFSVVMLTLVANYQWALSTTALTECYLAGFAVPLLVVHQWQSPLEDFGSVLRFALAIMQGVVTGTFAASTLKMVRQSVLSSGIRVDREQIRQLLSCVLFGTLVVFGSTLLFGTIRVLSHPEAMTRSLNAAACGISSVAVIALAVKQPRTVLAISGLTGLAIAGIQASWSQHVPVPFTAPTALQRSTEFIIIAGGLAAVYGLGLARVVGRSAFWKSAVRQTSLLLGVATLAGLFLVLSLEWTVFDRVSGTGLGIFSILTVAVMLSGLMATLISFAIIPERDPLSLNPQARMGYVYAAEGILALLFLHLYLSFPQLFSGRFREYWPFIVMVVAYIGVATGQFLQRYRMRVLAEPLQITGAFLPVLPVLAAWLSGGFELSGILFLVGLLYVMLSMWRRSIGFAISAAIAGNGGLWALLAQSGLSVLVRPQMFMIPPALSVLLAAQLNRRRLTATQLTALRYVAMTVIYVSSTGEMFINGVAESFWLPMVLALMSVGGVFAGIILRIRAFLYLGSSFLLLSMISMVWHATVALDHSWPWWAFGIVLGLLVLFVFGLFEKRRQEMIEMLGEFRHWES